MMIDDIKKEKERDIICSRIHCLPQPLVSNALFSYYQ